MWCSTERIGTLGVATLLAAATVISGGVAVAHAESIGGLIIHPGQSLDIESIRVHTSAGCPRQADAYYAMVTGYGFPPDGQVVTPNTAAGMSHTAGFDVYFQQTMKDFATANNTTLQGEYQVTVYCIDSFALNSFGEFTGAMRFTTPTEYEAIGAAKPAVQEPDPRAIVLEDLPPEMTNPGPAGNADGIAPGAAPPPGGAAAPGTADPPASTSNVASNGPGNSFPSPVVIAGIALGAVAVVGALLMYLLRVYT